MPHLNVLQKAFLDALVEQEVPLCIYLVRGVTLKGQIIRHDDFSVLLDRRGHSQLVYKQAISTIVPDYDIEIHATEKSPS